MATWAPIEFIAALVTIFVMMTVLVQSGVMSFASDVLLSVFLPLAVALCITLLVFTGYYQIWKPTPTTV